MVINKLHSPILLLDEQKCYTNIKRMADKAGRYGLDFKPHFKTHQSAKIGSWFKEFGIHSITVSSVDMANYFASRGWRDITIAFPVNIREIEAIDNLAGQVAQLSLFVINGQSVLTLDETLTHQISVYIEIDTGAQRSGLLPGQTEEISQLLALIDASENLIFRGFYSHPGHSYMARSKERINKIHGNVLSKMILLKENFPTAKVCIGDTPCCSVSENFEGIDEISPGNFVFNDLMQVQIGSCRFDDIAVVLAAPIVAKYPKRGEIILYCGAVHLSKEAIQWKGETIYGLPVSLSDNGWSAPINGSYIRALSQEHGILKCSKTLLQAVEIGDIIGILPVHSCLTVNLAESYYSLQSKCLIS